MHNNNTQFLYNANYNKCLSAMEIEENQEVSTGTEEMEIIMHIYK